MQNTHAQQMHFKALRVQAEKDEEEQFRQQVRFFGGFCVCVAGRGGGASVCVCEYV